MNILHALRNTDRGAGAGSDGSVAVAPHSDRSPRRALRRSVLAVVAAAVGCAGLTVAPASAMSIYGNWGYPGTTSLPYTHAGWTAMGTGVMTVPWRTVYESPQYARYDQWVCVTANAVRSSAGMAWEAAGSSTSCAWIPAAGTSASVNGAYFDMMGFNSFMYSANVVVTWKLSNNAVIGTRTYDYNRVSDFLCTTSKCSVQMTQWGGGAGISIA